MKILLKNTDLVLNRFNRMKLIKDVVIELLQKDHRYRDDDNKLLARIWYNESLKLGCSGHLHFLKLLSDGKLTSPESIRRSRQKIQQEHPELRGKKYQLRQQEAEEFKKELKENN